MEIISTKYSWNGKLSTRHATEYIIIHHAALNGSVENIHSSHTKQGWSGIGYHFYVRKDGKIYKGRPIDTIGAHTTGQNIRALGVCFEGNYETDSAMPAAQLKAGQELIAYLKTIYPKAQVKRHKDFNATACPGKHFPFDKIKEAKIMAELTTANDIAWELSQIVTIENVDGLVIALEKAKEDNSPLYWVLRKIVNQ